MTVQAKTVRIMLLIATMNSAVFSTVAEDILPLFDFRTSDMVLDLSTFTDNSNLNSEVLLISKATLDAIPSINTISSSNFERNTLTALRLSNISAKIVLCVFKDNFGIRGGAIHHSLSSLTNLALFIPNALTLKDS